MRARLQLVLSVDHDLFVGLEAGINERLAVTDLRDLDWTDCHRAVRIDDISVGPFRTLLHDRCGNGQAVMPRIDEQPRVDELARPELVRLVGKIRLELDRARGLQDLVARSIFMARPVSLDVEIVRDARALRMGQRRTFGIIAH